MFEGRGERPSRTLKASGTRSERAAMESVRACRDEPDVARELSEMRGSGGGVCVRPRWKAASNSVVTATLAVGTDTVSTPSIGL